MAAVSDAGRPIIAYGLNSASGGIAVRMWNDASWVVIDTKPGGIIPTDGIIQAVDLALVAGQRPILTWIDGSFATRLPVRALYWQNQTWSSFGGAGNEVEPLTSLSVSVSVTVAADQNPILAWHSGLSSGSSPTFVYLKKWSGSSWVELPTGSAQGAGLSPDTVYALRPKVVAPPAGEVVLAFDGAHDDGTSRVTVKRYSTADTDWQELPGTDRGFADESTYRGSSADVAFFSDGRPLVAIIDRAGTGLEIAVRVLQWTGSEWAVYGAGGVSAAGQQVTQPRLYVDDRNTVIVGYLQWFDGSFSDGAIIAKVSQGGTWNDIVPGSGSGRGISLPGEVPEFLSVAGRGGKVCFAWSYSAEQDTSPFGAHVTCAVL